jgi:hypothetical protein
MERLSSTYVYVYSPQLGFVALSQRPLPHRYGGAATCALRPECAAAVAFLQRRRLEGARLVLRQPLHDRCPRPCRAVRVGALQCVPHLTQRSSGSGSSSSGAGRRRLRHPRRRLRHPRRRRHRRVASRLGGQQLRDHLVHFFTPSSAVVVELGDVQPRKILQKCIAVRPAKLHKRMRDRLADRLDGHLRCPRGHTAPSVRPIFEVPID